jgi:hypothetical protein
MGKDAGVFIPTAYNHQPLPKEWFASPQGEMVMVGLFSFYP